MSIHIYKKSKVLSDLLGLKIITISLLHQISKKANTVANTLFCFFQRSQGKEETLKDENIKIFHLW